MANKVVNGWGIMYDPGLKNYLIFGGKGQGRVKINSNYVNGSITGRENQVMVDVQGGRGTVRGGTPLVLNPITFTYSTPVVAYPFGYPYYRTTTPPPPPPPPTPEYRYVQAVNRDQAFNDWFAELRARGLYGTTQHYPGDQYHKEGDYTIVTGGHNSPNVDVTVANSRAQINPDSSRVVRGTWGTAPVTTYKLSGGSPNTSGELMQLINVLDLTPRTYIPIGGQ